MSYLLTFAGFRNEKIKQNICDDCGILAVESTLLHTGPIFVKRIIMNDCEKSVS